MKPDHSVTFVGGEKVVKDLNARHEKSENLAYLAYLHMGQHYHYSFRKEWHDQGFNEGGLCFTSLFIFC